MASARQPQQDNAAFEEPGKLYRLIADSIPHLVWTARADGWVDFFNRRFLEYAGLAASQLEGWGWQQVLHHDDLERCLAAWSRALQSGQRYEVDCRLRRADGVWRWHRGTAVPARGPDGRIARWFGTCTDIEAEVRALRRSEQRFQAFMENSPAVAWIKDSKLRYTYASGPWLAALGKQAGEVLGKDDFALWPRDIAQSLRARDEEVLGRRESLQGVVTLPDMHGQERHWLQMKFTLPDGSGAPGVAGMAIEITQRIEAEERAKSYATDVRALLASLVTAQELERRRLADRLHDLIGQNLTALGIGLSTLKAALPQGSHVARFDAMAALVDATVDAIRGVMTELRPPALEEFGLVPALRAYAAEFSERTGMKVSTRVARAEARLPRDTELALFRIVQEALTNAAKHSGGKSAQIRMTKQAGCVRLSVEDDGHGFTDPGGARRDHRGGWGLPAMRERAEALGGRLRIEFPGRGTRIIVEIPSSDGD